MQVIIPHVADFHPVTAVKNVLIQASLSQLQNAGFYERYSKLVDPMVLEQLLSSLGPGWIPIELADAHYAACERLDLNPDELEKLGEEVGDRLQNTSLVSAAKNSRQEDVDVWAVAGSLHRMWARLYQGGSAQLSKAGPNEQLLELRGFKLTRYLYYRNASVPAIGAAYLALGVRLESLTIAKYLSSRDELTYRLRWT